MKLECSKCGKEISLEDHYSRQVKEREYKRVLSYDVPRWHSFPINEKEPERFCKDCFK